MDAFEREARISQLERDNARSLDELEERQAAHDPAAELEQMIAEHRSKPVGSPLVRRHGVTPPQAEPTPSDGVDSQTLARALGEVVAHERNRERREREAALVERDRRIGELEGELKEIRSLVGDVLQRLEQSNTAIRNLAGDLENERRARADIELRFADLRGRIAGLVRDFSYG